LLLLQVSHLSFQEVVLLLQLCLIISKVGDLIGEVRDAFIGIFQFIHDLVVVISQPFVLGIVILLKLVEEDRTFVRAGGFKRLPQSDITEVLVLPQDVIL
jgi:hypothetical protein